MLIPTQQAPSLVLPTLADGEIELADQTPQNFTQPDAIENLQLCHVL
jgi:hypothetical protein